MRKNMRMRVMGMGLSLALLCASLPSGWLPVAEAAKPAMSSSANSVTILSAGLPAPEDLRLIDSTRTKAYLAWSAPYSNEEAAGYRVYKDGSLLGTVTDESFVADNLTPNTSYTFTVTALDSNSKETAASSPLVVTTKPAALPAPTISHPRLYVSSQDDIAELQARILQPKGSQVWAQIVTDSDANGPSDALLPAGGGQTNDDAAVRSSIESAAIRYLVEGDPVIGQKAVDMLVNFLTTLELPTGNYTEHLAAGDTLHMAALVYDWCYDLLSSQEKTTIITELERIAEVQEVGYPPVNQGAVTSHAGGNALMRNLIAAGVAIYDEDPSMYDVAAERFFDEFVPARNFAYAAGMHHQGAFYTWQRFEGEIYAARIFDALGYDDIYIDGQGDVPYDTIYGRRPDGQVMRDGDNVKTRATHGTYWEYPNMFMLTAGLYDDPYVQYEFQQMYQPGNTNQGHPSPYMQLLFADVDDPGIAPTDLPLTRYFGYPQGQMVARTGWQMDEDMHETHSSPTVVAEMKIGEYNFNNHSHLDAGDFELYYNGALAIDSGAYQGLDSNGNMQDYGSPPDVNYHKKSIAHNTILVHDPDETMSGTVNDGGQRWPNFRQEAKTLDDVFEKGYRSGEVLAQQFGPDPQQPDFSYLKGDIADAYTSKVEDVERSFVFMNLKDTDHPAAMIVYDRVVSSDASFDKTWLLHSIEEPGITGNVTTITRTEKDYNGKLVNTTLLPASGNLDIASVGGPEHEFEVNGVNYPTIAQGQGNSSDEGGAWRIEVSPVNDATEDRFLNVMQVMDDKDGPTPLTVGSIDSTLMVGATLADRAVLFSKSGDRLEGPITFDLTSSEPEVKVLVTDLTAGYWTVTESGQSATGEYEVTKEGGTLYFAGTPGTYTLERAEIRSLPEPTPVSTAMPTYPTAEIAVTVDSKKLAFSLPPEEVNGTIMAPHEMLLYQIGAQYSYDAGTQTITATRDQLDIKLTVGSTNATVNGQSVTVAEAPYVVNECIYIPLEFAVTSLGLTGFLDADTSTFNISTTTGPDDSTPLKKLAIQGVTSSIHDPVMEGYTIDGQIVAADRWAAEGDGQWIQYDLGTEKLVSAVGIAWYLGDQRNWVFDVQVSNDGVNWRDMIMGRVTSGSTVEVEKHRFDSVSARFVRIVGHGNTWPSPWNSITEVEVYTPIQIELDQYTVSAVSSSINDPVMDGYTVDGQIVAADRWAAEGDGQWIQYDLGAAKEIGAVGIAWHLGDQRTWVFDVQVSDDGSTWTDVITGKHTSGETLGIETHPFPETTARYVRIVGHGNTYPSSWNSITEVEIYDTDELEFTRQPVPLSQVSSILNDPIMEGYTIDRQIIADDRWAAEGDGSWIQYDLGSEQRVGAVGIAWYAGERRNWVFDITVSSDGSNWTEIIHNRHSAGRTEQVEVYDFPVVDARFVRIVGHGNTYPSPWNSILEVEIFTAASQGPTLTSTIDGLNEVESGMQLQVTAGLANVGTTIYASELEVHYDPALFDYVSAAPASAGWSLVSTDTSTPGTVKAVLAAQGTFHAITSSDAELLNVNFEARSVSSATSTVIDIMDAHISDGAGLETLAAVATHEIEVLPSSLLRTDPNGDGLVDTADLDLIAANAGKSNGDLDWQLGAWKTDANRDGVVNVVDLAAVGQSVDPSVASNEVSILAFGQPPQWDSLATLTATDVTKTGLTLTWPAASDAIGVSGYRIYQDGAQIDEVVGSVALIGFESGEGYTAGSLYGQNGWAQTVSVGGGAVVQTSDIYGGTQAVAVSTPASSAQYEYEEAILDVPSTTDGVITFRHNQPDQATALSFLKAVDGSGNTMAHVRFSNGNVQARYNGTWNGLGSTYTENTWQEWKLVMDHAEQTYDLYRDRIVVNTDVPFYAAGNEVSQLSIGTTTRVTSTTATSYFDELQVAAATTSYAVTDLQGGVEYEFKVEAGNPDNDWSTDGPELTVSTVVSELPPTWNQGVLSASDISDTSLTLTWTEALDPTGVSGYKVYQDGTEIAELDGPTTVIGFESGEGYAASSLYAQHGWTQTVSVGGGATVQSTDIYDGDQAVTVTTPSTSAQYEYEEAALTVPSTTDSIITFGHNQPDKATALTFFKAVDASGNTMAHVRFSNGNVQARHSGTWNGLGVTYNEAVWHEWRLVLDHTTDTYDLYRDGVSVMADIPFYAAGSEVSEIRIGTTTRVTGSGGAGHFDAIRIAEDDTSYTVTGLTPGTEYDFKVEAGNSGGAWSADGPAITVSTTGTTGDPQDLNGDGQVRLGDLGIAAYYYGSSATDTNWTQASIADVNADGTVDGLDFTSIVNSFNP